MSVSNDCSGVYIDTLTGQYRHHFNIGPLVNAQVPKVNGDQQNDQIDLDDGLGNDNGRPLICSHLQNQRANGSLE